MESAVHCRGVPGNRRVASHGWRAAVLVGLVVTAGACASLPSTDMPSAAADTPSTISLVELMQSVVDPAAGALWAAVATIATPDGVKEIRPRSDQEWDTLRHQAVRLVESSRLLGATVGTDARSAFWSDYLGIELERSDLPPLHDNDPERWTGLVTDFSRVAATMLDAIERRDADRLFNEGGPLDLTCARCHRTYWDSDEAPRRIPSMRRDAPAPAGAR